jgi:hypothetical protein
VFDGTVFNGNVRPARIAVLMCAVMLALTACGSSATKTSPAKPQSTTKTPATATAPSPAQAPAATGPAAAKAPVPGLPKTRLVGFSVPDYPPDPAALRSVQNATGIRPGIVSWYTGLGQPFDPGHAAQVAGGGALPLIEIDSDSHPLTQVTSGAWDDFLIGYARAVAAYRAPVAIDFNHEFNGNWSTWGPKRNSAKAFVAAWQRIVTIFRRNGADNVIWVWNPNVSSPGVADMRAFYPGNQYVTWTGIDGYFFTGRDTYMSVFPATLRELATITAKPVLVVETGAAPGPRRPAQITSLFASLRAAKNIIGLIWFDYDKGPGDDWRLEDDRASVTAFRDAAGAYAKERVRNTRSG